eukprot:SAG31_NODE_1738_length_7402_cov_14.270163_4_plen_109_part_00
MIADLCDPLMGPQEASAVFAVLLEQFRASSPGRGKLLVADDVHNYIGDPCSASPWPMAEALVDAARMMRHEGLRLTVAAGEGCYFLVFVGLIEKYGTNRESVTLQSHR